jgi:hypothetical protein
MLIHFLHVTMHTLPLLSPFSLYVLALLIPWLLHHQHHLPSIYSTHFTWRWSFLAHAKGEAGHVHIFLHMAKPHHLSHSFINPSKTIK